MKIGVSLKGVGESVGNRCFVGLEGCFVLTGCLEVGLCAATAMTAVCFRVRGGNRWMDTLMIHRWILWSKVGEVRPHKYSCWPLLAIRCECNVVNVQGCWESWEDIFQGRLVVVG